MEKFIYNEMVIMPATVTLPAYTPDPDTKLGDFVEVGRYKCPAGFVMGLGWGENRGQVQSTGRAYGKLSSAADVIPRGIWRIVLFDAAGVPRTEPIELDSSEMEAVIAERQTWKVFEKRNLFVRQNSTIRFFFMSYEDAEVIVTQVKSKLFIDGSRSIA